MGWLLSRKRSASAGLRYSLFAIVALLPALAFGREGLTDTGEAVSETRLEPRLSGIEIPFIENQGQTDRRVAYYASTFAGTVFVTREGEIVYSLSGPEQKAGSTGRRSTGSGWALTETLTGGRSRPEAEGVSATRVSSFIGSDPSRWRSGVATHQAVSLGEVWPGVGVVLRAYGDNVEKLFTVSPGASAKAIRIRMSGARSLRVDERGRLVAGTGLGDLHFSAPVAWQEIGGVRRPVEVAYRARDRAYGFRLGGYDPTLPVVIDPVIATYLGGSTTDAALGLAIAPSGQIYVAGETDSTDFPGTAGGAQPIFRSGSDAFVARLDAGLTTLLQATYLGGGGVESVSNLAVNPASGEIYVLGTTDAPDFPKTAGGAQPVFGGGQNDSYVARLNSGLTELLQATYVGGGRVDFASDLALDPISGGVYVAGVTSSTDFPRTSGGAQPAFGGGNGFDGYVARLNLSLTTLLQATFLGASGDDQAMSVTFGSGTVYVGGLTGSDNFPGTAGGAQPVRGGLTDAFVARLNAGLTTLLQASYLGGRGQENNRGLAVHPFTGDLYVTGSTTSDEFPATAGGAQPTVPPGSVNGYVARLNSGLTTLFNATYLGCDGTFPQMVAVHPVSGEIYVAGQTYCATLLGASDSDQPAPGGLWDGFVARLDAGLTTVLRATYLGGSGGLSNAEEGASRVSIHPISGDVYVAGFTDSTNFPDTAAGAQPTLKGVVDAFVARYQANLKRAIPIRTKIAINIPEPTGTHFWWDTPIHVVVFAEGESEIAETRCLLDPVTPPQDFEDLPPGCAFTGNGADVASDGTHVLYAASIDVAGNAESPVLAVLKIDTTPPAVACGPPPTFLLGGNGGTVSAVVTDQTSGAVTSPVTVAVTPSDVATEGVQSKAVTGLDIAGNTTTVSCSYFVVRTGCEERAVNDRVDFRIVRVFTRADGNFEILADLSNTSSRAIAAPVKAVVTTLTAGNHLISATEGDGTPGSKQAIEVGDALESGATVRVQFLIGLNERKGFSFFVDVVTEECID